MSRRTVTVSLTDKQFEALAGAVALAEVEWPEMEGDGDGGYFARQRGVLERGWTAVAAAWHAAARRDD